MKNEPLLGRLIEGDALRDAVHIAIAPVRALELLLPGQFVELFDGAVRTCKDGHAVGIVDPFLVDPVRSGECFWLFLLPRTITSLRHDWTHPSFVAASSNIETRPEPAESLVERSKAWLRNYDRTLGKYEGWAVMHATDFLDHDDYVNCGDTELYLPDDFWDHFQIATGRIVMDNQRGSFFSCSC